MKAKRQNILAILIGMAFMTLAITYSVNDQNDLEDLNKTYFESFNESFEGIITEIENEYNVHTCMLSIDLTTATTMSYDLRKTSNNYYAVIKDKKAEIIEHIKYENGTDGEIQNKFQPNDYFVFNGLKDSAYLYRDNVLIDKWKPIINDFEFVTIRNKHKIEN